MQDLRPRDDERDLCVVSGSGRRRRVKVGDRIELKYMPDDPNPVPSNTKGTIVRVTERMPGGGTQYAVDWDNGRTLSVIVPPDLIERVE
jgi:hypothetical protein